MKATEQYFACRTVEPRLCADTNRTELSVHIIKVCKNRGSTVLFINFSHCQILCFFYLSLVHPQLHISHLPSQLSMQTRLCRHHRQQQESHLQAVDHLRRMLPCSQLWKDYRWSRKRHSKECSITNRSGFHGDRNWKRLITLVIWTSWSSSCVLNFQPISYRIPRL